MSATSPQPQTDVQPRIDQPVEPAGGTEQHGARAHSDGGWDTRVPVQTRSERFASADVDAFPAVTGREVNWKFAPLAKIRPLLDGDLDGAAYPFLARESGGTHIDWVRSDDERVGSAGLPEDRASAAAWSARDAVLAITVRGDEPGHVTITRSAMGPEPRAAHTVITAEANSTGIVIVNSTGSALLSENVEIVVEDGARLTVVAVQDWDDDAVHVGTHFAQVGRDAFLKHVVVSLGGDVVRINPSTRLGAQGGDTEMYGVYFADAGQYIEQQVYVNHDAPNTRSRVNYKGALQGEGAHTVWIGDVLIGRPAAGTDSYEQNRNLVLSEGTRADSIPNLEIETGDIQGAGHASATGRFDDEHLFYLQSRGITEDEARRLVVLGFLVDVVQKIGDPDLEERLVRAIEQELAGGRTEHGDLA
ncbi:MULTISPECIES: Fe-S cluster assembly protein SufD [unclassified Curtobacterium]|uniref:Fe-S cluster assembly protein SufD n=1 Tax=unclassified Curtobacterium TaxID=257496 RepID=UPI000DAA065E|nr:MULTISPECIES: Fe-S cluster assembly protein SufD [unclassified Curtobacterium]PZE28779.1 Fe-S cluster assembly protein SufD [Curtobacterium sp. MCBD17_028]PZE77130.1 Fe-S cluster assembly protein SufD [Curtobacterium sp. MCBD17_019]WIB62253.1 Fe-S cluster assembly protein SufD [Curtobacterium sp. MCBD17_040]